MFVGKVVVIQNGQGLCNENVIVERTSRKGNQLEIRFSCDNLTIWLTIDVSQLVREAFEIK